MVYFYTLLIFSSIFIILSMLFSFYLKFKKNFKRINSLERKLLWKFPKKYGYVYALIPKLTEMLILRNKNKLIESELLELLNNLSSNLSGGVSVTGTIADCLPKIKPPLKNELSLYLILSKEHSSIKALEHMINKTKNVFLKMLWIMLLAHYKSGNALADNLKRLYKMIYIRINIKERINAQLLQSKIQMIVGTILPYFLFLVMNILCPYLIGPVLESSFGLLLLFFAFILHAIGVYIFIRMTRFNSTTELNNALLCEYISFSIRSGTSIITTLNEIKCSGLINNTFEQIINNSASTSELISNLEKTNEPFIDRVVSILKKGYQLGIPICDELSGQALDITEKLEQRALRFQQAAPSKALIPLLLCIFPATYLLILTPIIVFTIQQ